MSLTVHLASMPRRSGPNAAAQPISEEAARVEAHGAPAGERGVGGCWCGARGGGGARGPWPSPPPGVGWGFWGEGERGGGWKRV